MSDIVSILYKTPYGHSDPQSTSEHVRVPMSTSEHLRSRSSSVAIGEKDSPREDDDVAVGEDSGVPAELGRTVNKKIY